MKVTNEMRLRRALRYAEEERASEIDAFRKLEGINLTDVIVLRNKKAMYIAEVEQMIRNLKTNIEREERGA